MPNLSKIQNVYRASRKLRPGLRIFERCKSSRLPPRFVNPRRSVTGGEILKGEIRKNSASNARILSKLRIEEPATGLILDVNLKYYFRKIPEGQAHFGSELVENYKNENKRDLEEIWNGFINTGSEIIDHHRQLVDDEQFKNLDPKHVTLESKWSGSSMLSKKGSRQRKRNVMERQLPQQRYNAKVCGKIDIISSQFNSHQFGDTLTGVLRNIMSNSFHTLLRKVSEDNFKKRERMSVRKTLNPSAGGINLKNCRSASNCSSFPATRKKGKQQTIGLKPSNNMTTESPNNNQTVGVGVEVPSNKSSSKTNAFINTVIGKHEENDNHSLKKLTKESFSLASININPTPTCKYSSNEKIPSEDFSPLYYIDPKLKEHEASKNSSLSLTKHNSNYANPGDAQNMNVKPICEQSSENVRSKTSFLAGCSSREQALDNMSAPSKLPTKSIATDPNFATNESTTPSVENLQKTVQDFRTLYAHFTNAVENGNMPKRHCEDGRKFQGNLLESPPSSIQLKPHDNYIQSNSDKGDDPAIKEITSSVVKNLKSSIANESKPVTSFDVLRKKEEKQQEDGEILKATQNELHKAIHSDRNNSDVNSQINSGSPISRIREPAKTQRVVGKSGTLESRKYDIRESGRPSSSGTASPDEPANFNIHSMKYPPILKKHQNKKSKDPSQQRSSKLCFGSQNSVSQRAVNKVDSKLLQKDISKVLIDCNRFRIQVNQTDNTFPATPNCSKQKPMSKNDPKLKINNKQEPQVSDHNREIIQPATKDGTKPLESNCPKQIDGTKSDIKQTESQNSPEGQTIRPSSKVSPATVDSLTPMSHKTKTFDKETVKAFDSSKYKLLNKASPDMLKPSVKVAPTPDEQTSAATNLCSTDNAKKTPMTTNHCGNPRQTQEKRTFPDKLKASISRLLSKSDKRASQSSDSNNCAKKKSGTAGERRNPSRPMPMDPPKKNRMGFNLAASENLKMSESQTTPPKLGNLCNQYEAAKKQFKAEQDTSTDCSRYNTKPNDQPQSFAGKDSQECQTINKVTKEEPVQTLKGTSLKEAKGDLLSKNESQMADTTDLQKRMAQAFNSELQTNQNLNVIQKSASSKSIQPSFQSSQTTQPKTSVQLCSGLATLNTKPQVAPISNQKENPFATDCSKYKSSDNVVSNAPTVPLIKTEADMYKPLDCSKYTNSTTGNPNNHKKPSTIDCTKYRTAGKDIENCINSETCKDTCSKYKTSALTAEHENTTENRGFKSSDPEEIGTKTESSPIDCSKYKSTATPFKTENKSAAIVECEKSVGCPKILASVDPGSKTKSPSEDQKPNSNKNNVTESFKTNPLSTQNPIDCSKYASRMSSTNETSDEAVKRTQNVTPTEPQKSTSKRAARTCSFTETPEIQRNSSDCLQKPIQVQPKESEMTQQIATKKSSLETLKLDSNTLNQAQKPEKIKCAEIQSNEDACFKPKTGPIEIKATEPRIQTTSPGGTDPQNGSLKFKFSNMFPSMFGKKVQKAQETNIKNKYATPCSKKDETHSTIPKPKTCQPVMCVKPEKPANVKEVKANIAKRIQMETNPALFNCCLKISGPKKVEVANCPMPIVSDDSVIVKMHSVGLCCSDIFIFEEGLERIETNIKLGHEGAGEVIEVGPRTKYLNKGDRVCIETGVPCSRCKYCKEGRYNICPNMQFTGVLSTYCSHPANFCHKIPGTMSYEEAALVHPLSLGLQACSRGRVGVGSKVLILGACPLGLSSLMAARAMGADKIAIVDVLKKNLQVASELCADVSLEASETMSSKELVENILCTMKCRPNVIIDCCGCSKTVNMAIEIAEKGGHFILAGSQTKCVNLPMLTTFAKELSFHTSFRSSNMYPIAITLIEQGRAEVKKMITHRTEFCEIQKGFDVALNDLDNEAIKVMVNWPHDKSGCKMN